MTATLDARVATLVAEGRYGEAAALCAEHGELLRAAELYAAVWDFARSIALAESAGAPSMAYGHAVRAESEVEIERIVVALAERAGPEAERALELATSRRRWRDVARLAEAVGRYEQAAAAWEQEGELVRAGLLLEKVGRARDAGRLYERRLAHASDGRAALHFGRVLASFGKLEEAVRAFQQATSEPSLAGAAERWLVACLSALGLDDAAAVHLDALRARDSALPRTVPMYLEESFGDRLGPFAAQGAAQATPVAGRYRVIRFLGAGSSGRVFLAEDVLLERRVALKVLSPPRGPSGRDALTRFAREARVAMRASHPNLVRVFDFDPEGPYLVMEAMLGGTLDDRLERRAGPLSLVETRAIVEALLDALGELHSHGVVHRDVKPSNVLVGEAGELKLGDFGAAHLADLGATHTGAMLGTLAYMAPEVVLGDARPDASTDLYSLGVVAYRCLTGRLPFDGPDLVTQKLSRAAPRPSAYVDGLPPALDALVVDMLMRSPNERVRSAAEAKGRLEAAWSGGARAERDDVPYRGAAPSAAPASVAPPSDGARSSRPPATAVSWPTPRYVALEQAGLEQAGLEQAGLEGGAGLAFDRWLDRKVRLSHAVPGMLARLASVRSPWLQTIHDRVDDDGPFVLEWLPARTPGADDLDGLEVAAHVDRCLDEAARAFAEAGLPPPPRDPRRVVLTPSGPVYRLDDLERSGAHGAALGEDDPT